MLEKRELLKRIKRLDGSYTANKEDDDNEMFSEIQDLLLDFTG